MARLVKHLMCAAATATTATAAPAMTADVEYAFIDKNGVGWVSSSGTVTVSLAFTKDGGSLVIRGKRQVHDAQLKGSPGGAPDVDGRSWEADANESYPLRNVARRDGAITFEVEPLHDKLTGRCAPVKIAQIASKTLYECALSGFRWKAVPSLPELHHPIVLEASAKAKHRVLNKLGGATRPQFGKRTVSAVEPPKAKGKSK